MFGEANIARVGDAGGGGIGKREEADDGEGSDAERERYVRVSREREGGIKRAQKE